MSEPARVLVAPDSFKGTFSAGEVAAAVAAGIERAGLVADRCPIADGGEGTLEVLVGARGGSIAKARVTGPGGDPVRARFGLLDGGELGLIEAAEACGLGLVEVGERDAEAATTRGVGELILAAVEGGAERLMVAVGGTATTDGGAGAVEEVRAAGGLGGRELTVLCDVVTGFGDAARVFSAQKGADPAAVERLTERLAMLALEYPRDPREVSGGGAGGGLAGGLWAALGAELVPGARGVFELIGLRERLERADAVVVGEGRLDAQTEQGKAIAEICAWAAEASTRVDAIVGRSELAEPGLSRLGLASAREATTLAQLTEAGAELARALAGDARR